MSPDEIALTRRKYQDEGFIVCPEPLLPSDVVEGAVAGMDALRDGKYDTGIPPRPSSWSPGDDPNSLCKIEMPQIASNAIMELVSHPSLGAKAAEITGAEAVQVWWVQLLYKPPTEAGQQVRTHVGWHQDYNYWSIWEDDSELFTAWVALSDVAPDCGPMNFVVGSHSGACPRKVTSFRRITMPCATLSAPSRIKSGKRCLPFCRRAAPAFTRS